MTGKRFAAEKRLTARGMLKLVPAIDLIALDLDGTLLDPAERISPANRAAVSAALAAGVRVVLVTGRGTDAPAEIAADLRLNLPIICAHGAITKDTVTGRVLGHIPVPLRYAKPMIEYAEANALHAAVYVDERFHRLAGMHPYMQDMRGPHWREIATFAGFLTSAPTFIRFLGREAAAAIRENFGDLPVHYKYETFGDYEELAVTSIEATKKNALARLCEDLGVPPARVLAVGDSRNDVPMLRWAGIGVAMGNAQPDVKAAVEHVTARNDEDGVALAIERYVLGNGTRKRKSA